MALGRPVRSGEPLISKVGEVSRNLILSDEEDRLLAASAGHRAHLQPIIICGFDTAMRQGKIFKLRQRGVDLESRLISLHAAVIKTGPGVRCRSPGGRGRRCEHRGPLRHSDPTI